MKAFLSVLVVVSGALGLAEYSQAQTGECREVRRRSTIRALLSERPADARELAEDVARQFRELMRSFSEEDLRELRALGSFNNLAHNEDSEHLQWVRRQADALLRTRINDLRRGDFPEFDCQELPGTGGLLGSRNMSSSYWVDRFLDEGFFVHEGNHYRLCPGQEMGHLEMDSLGILVRQRTFSFGVEYTRVPRELRVQLVEDAVSDTPDFRDLMESFESHLPFRIQSSHLVNNSMHVNSVSVRNQEELRSLILEYRNPEVFTIAGDVSEHVSVVDLTSGEVLPANDASQIYRALQTLRERAVAHFNRYRPGYLAALELCSTSHSLEPVSEPLKSTVQDGHRMCYQVSYRRLAERRPVTADEILFELSTTHRITEDTNQCEAFSYESLETPVPHQRGPRGSRSFSADGVVPVQ